MQWKPWGAFLFLGALAWGTSFLWIKIALQEIGPLTLVTYRMLFGAATAWLLTAVIARRITVARRHFGFMILLGLLNTAVPVTLISWSELHISSGLAGVLNSSVPLWTIIIAHFILPDDRFTAPKIAGLLTGFAGVVILISRDVGPAGFAGTLWGQLAVIVAAAMYGLSNVLVRRNLRGVHPLHTASVSLTAATVYMAIAAPLIEAPFAVPQLGMTWLACAWMGIIGMGLAYLAYFYLINTWGATRTALVTYVFPVTAVLLGIVFLGERPSWHVFAGGALIIGGIALVNRRRA